MRNIKGLALLNLPGIPKARKDLKNNLTLPYEYGLYGDELSYPHPLLACPVTHPNPLSEGLNLDFGMKATEKQTRNATSVTFTLVTRRPYWI